jgi:hypothetical protein
MGVYRAMSGIDYKALEADGQMRKMVENLTDRGWTASEIMQRGCVGLQYEQVDRIRQQYLKAKLRLHEKPEPDDEPPQEPAPEPPPKPSLTKGGPRFNLEPK